MWKGRFQKETSDLVKRYGESVSFDWRLYAQDIRGSIAHAEALQRAKIITTDDLKKIKAGLKEIEKEIREGTFTWKLSLEDVHMNIESALTEKIGDAGARLHTARSRNDQVALDCRLYCRDEARLISTLITGLQRSFVEAGLRSEGVVIPGYTHLQRGQPVLLGHHLLAYVEMLARDSARLDDCEKRLNVMPLGSGALAGSTIVLDRAFIAEQLGFPAITRNSMDAVSDRDFVAEMLFVITLCGIHLSRLAEDLILWSSAEFGFITLSDAHTTGSSLMPQKKNPDVAELTRGKSGRLLGNLVSLLTTLKGLPMTYNRDLQEDKERLFDSIDTIKLALRVNAEMIDGMTVNEAAMRAAASDPFLLATDIADYLVKKGIPFRKAHDIVGKLTAFSLSRRIPFQEIPLEDYQQFDPIFEAGVYNLFDLTTALRARQAVGAPSPSNVARELRRWQKILDKKE